MFIVVFFPFLAQAKIISFVSNLFASGNEVWDKTAPNSQQMNLLEAPLSPFNSIGGGDVIIDGGALLVEGGLLSGQGDSLHEPGKISVYVVREGDSLSQIAKMFNVSVNTIRWGNDIKGNTIAPGQTLVILPISGIRHTVTSGDTLEKISSRYKGDVEEIIAYNNISKDSKLAVGEILVIPGGIIPESSPTVRTSSSSSGSQSRPSSGAPVYEGYYLRPISGGYRSQGIHGYNGVDLAASAGTSIMASASGVVTVSRNSGWNGGYGNYIVISHPNGTQTLYAHNRSNTVSVGEQVKQGQVIGYVGSTGRSTGPHVHFEIRGAKNPF